MPTRVAVGERRREVFEVRGITRWTVRRLDLRSPTRRAPDRDQDLDPSLLCAADEIVEVVEPIRGIEGVRSARRPGRSRVLPHHDRPQDGRIRVASAVEHRCSVGPPAEARIILQTDEQASRHRVLREHDRLPTLRRAARPRARSQARRLRCRVARAGAAWLGVPALTVQHAQTYEHRTFAHPTPRVPRSVEIEEVLFAGAAKQGIVRRRSGFRDDTQDVPQRARARRSCTRGLRRQPVPGDRAHPARCDARARGRSGTARTPRRVGTPRPARAPRHALTAPLLVRAVARHVSTSLDDIHAHRYERDSPAARPAARRGRLLCPLSVEVLSDAEAEATRGPVQGARRSRTRADPEPARDERRRARLRMPSHGAARSVSADGVPPHEAPARRGHRGARAAGMKWAYFSLDPDAVEKLAAIADLKGVLRS